MADPAADSDSSALSEHSDKEIQKLAPIFIRAKKASKEKFPPPVVSPPRPKRPPSPPHEVVLADNPAIAFIVMFRSRFNEALSSKLPHFGPQDIERGVVDSAPSVEVQQLLCAILGLVLNRKKPVERGHHGRALEEAVQSMKAQWPRRWKEKNPLSGGTTFENMSPTERLDILQTLAMWSLTSSEAIQGILKEKYKQQRHNDDENQPLSVQPWGLDGDKRRYFLVQGLDDTSFRVYREASRYTRNATWYNQAGTIEEIKALATKLQEVDGSQAARRLATKMTNAIPMFEASEEKRRRRDYRREQRARFSRPEPGFSLYEGRTRGKRMRYTYDDDDALESDATSTRRSNRNSTRSTPFEAGPTVTSSGRQVRQARQGGYGESLLSGPPISTDELAPEYDDPEHLLSTRGRSARSTRSETEDSEPVRGAGRHTRSGVNGISNPRKRTHDDSDDMSDEEDAPSGDEWDSEKNDDDEHMPDGDDDMSEADDEEDEEQEPQSLVVKLRVPAKQPKHETNGAHSDVKTENGTASSPTDGEEPTKAGAPKSEPDRLQQRDTAASSQHTTNGDHETIQKHAETAAVNGTPASPTLPAANVHRGGDPVSLEQANQFHAEGKIDSMALHGYMHSTPDLQKRMNEAHKVLADVREGA